jgi:hypothetical protein
MEIFYSIQYYFVRNLRTGERCVHFQHGKNNTTLEEAMEEARGIGDKTWIEKKGEPAHAQKVIVKTYSSSEKG